MAVRIVTDSTSDLPQELAQSLGVTVVPLYVHFGEDVLRDGVDLSADEFYARLASDPMLPKTSQPSPGDFLQVYEKLAKESDGILSVHISSKISGTFNSAMQAKEQVAVACPIHVLDTRQASMGLGRIVLAAADAAGRGADLEEVTRVADGAAERSECVALFDTLEYLEKGGRIGKAHKLLGTLLRIKPMIIIREGVVHELAKERSRKRAIARLEREAKDFAPLEELTVLYSTTPDEAHRIAENLHELLPKHKEPLIARFGPVIGTYTGPGALGIGVLRAEAP